MPHEKDRPASGRTYVEPGELSARERNRHQKQTPTMSIPLPPQVQQQQQPQPTPTKTGDDLHPAGEDPNP